MNRHVTLLAVAGAILAGAATAPLASAAADAAKAPATAGPQPLPAHSERPVCGVPAAKAARCFAHVVTHQDGATPLATTSYQSGWAPADLASAYKLPSSATITPGSGPTVAIVDAFDNPAAATDLDAYRAQFGLGACDSGCFTKVNQNGVVGAYPTGDTGWGAEIDLDLDMVSAACPNCRILLVEATDNSFANLMTAAGYAVNHAAFVSNSYGGPEFSGETSYDSVFDRAGVAVTVSSGDNGYGVQYPAASPNVTAVGGTSLSKASTARGWSETTWSGAGSGCSALEPKPSWQHDAGCSRRTVADVSAVANPNTGVAVYDSYGSTSGNWFVYGGTSVASPFVAAVWALGPAVGTTVRPPSIPYTNVAGWFDVTSGANTSRCRSGYLCQAVTGYDGPTGLGTPNGVTGFGGTGGGTGTNNPPTAAFASSCSGLTCNFTDQSSDSDGTIASRSWDFGDTQTSTATNPPHTYSSANTYTVRLTVTDNGGLSSSVTHSVTVPGPSGGITLTASGRKIQGLEYVDLHWTGTSSAVDVYRGTSEIAKSQPGPSYTDTTNNRGGATFTYQVCVAGGTTACSNPATVTF